ncbi:hypothetical protein BBF96_00095 [Anoxybacter fermentans]|uniref:Class II aldolase/adducin N-terminal domain-containing protein n=1 Tax=Anoxybacter fermentans TaxID=1323375 RepID=A0A3S9SUI5_9FIRM|nr:class II aldolase/adducin family protein [Anoxybacter fermentans]AZR71945.1 hypothetical protein BBF96_00095 [Anoxybacter fermentans]
MLMLEVRKKVIETARKMLKYGLTTGTFGNISIRHQEILVAITPSGVDYESMIPEDVVIVDLNGQVIDGDLKPSSEMPMHLALYRKRADIQAVVHTHSPYASAFAVLGQEIPVVLAEMASVVGGSVKVAPYCRPGSAEMGREVVRCLRDRTGVLLANHGVVAIGSTVDEALGVAQVIEDSARIYQLAVAMGNPRILPEDEIRVLREQYIKHYGQK